ncbi:MAG: archaeosortase A [Halobacteriota archaeon]
MQTLLWIALVLFIIATAAPRKIAYPLGTAGWVFFALHWAYQPVYYLAIDDYFNVLVTVLVAVFCGYVGYMMWTKADDLTLLITKAAAIGGIFYFSFAELSSLNHVLIAAVATQTVLILNFLSVPAVQAEWNVLTLNGAPVQIILGCTGIESIALFLGVISCVSAPPRRKLAAFMISIPTIYVLNIFRNAFVLTATGNQWFGLPDNSFYVSHDVISKFGSLGALLLISYLVFLILPELLDMVVGVFDLLKGGVTRAS